MALNGWGVEEGGDATNRFVIGTEKEKAIKKRNPILHWYSQVFKAVCDSDNVLLFVSGYSFNDDHINKAIADGVANAGLRVWVHNPESPEFLRKRLTAKGEAGVAIWKGLMGYSTQPLHKILETLGPRTGEGDRIRHELL